MNHLQFKLLSIFSHSKTPGIGFWSNTGGSLQTIIFILFFIAFINFLIAATRFAKANKMRNRNSNMTPRERFVDQSRRQAFLADQSAKYYSLTRRTTMLMLILICVLTLQVYFFWMNHKTAAIVTELLFLILVLLIT
ncbi:hypothetical protein [Loigolactobacillus zhaoyuanensis]|uniref:Uncharacterized protein n=1 Tax=Loigolactobacillus zhaoyuanensis TaxID=2486017 RepID=A0ABW8UF57_9LACO